MNTIQKLKNKIINWWGWPGLRPWSFERIKTYYYNVKFTIINYFKYAKIIARYRPWSYTDIIEMLRFQLNELCNNIEKYGIEIDETRLPKIADMRRAIEILDSHITDNYADRCGYIEDAIKIKYDDDLNRIIFEKRPEYKDYDINKIFKDARELEMKEWEELFTILKKMKEWWD